MALFEGSAAGIGTGLIVGLAAAIVAPVLLPVVVNVGRPLLKGAIKGAIMAYGRGQEVVGEVTETLEDLTVEARAEMNAKGEAAPTRTRRTTAGGRKRTRRGRAAEAATAA